MSRGPLAVIAGLVIVVVVALSFSALRAGRSAADPSPSPSTTASPPIGATPTVAVSATATSTAGASSVNPSAGPDRYGYVFTADPDRIVVLRERDGETVFELTGVAAAVSLDGKRLAYWRTTPNVGALDLRVLDVADRASDRSVLTVTDQTLGGAVAWSNDAQGLLVATRSREVVGPFSAPARYDLLMLDLASSPPSTRPAATQVSGGSVYLPVAWDRPGRIAAAVVTGEGGYASEYVTWNGNAAISFARVAVPSEAGEGRARTLLVASTVQASADAKLVMGLESSTSVLRVWPILDITKADHVRNPSRIGSVVWRPGPTAPYEVIWAVGQKIDLFRYGTDSSRTLYTTTEQGLGPIAVRPDGSGVLVVQSGSGATAQLVAIDVTTRQATTISARVQGLRILPRGVLLR